MRGCTFKGTAVSHVSVKQVNYRVTVNGNLKTSSLLLVWKEWGKPWRSCAYSHSHKSRRVRTSVFLQREL